MLSILGIIVLLVMALLLSENRKAINLRTVSLALLIQTCFAGIVLYIPLGKTVLGAVSGGVQHVINFANSGISFVFGDLANYKLGFIFAINVLPILIFFSALMSVLYYLGIMQWIIGNLGGAISRVLGTSRVESVAAAGNIFVSQTEAPLLVRPYVAGLSRPELFAVMTCGVASIAGSVLAGYANLGIELKYLIAASFMAAPGGLLMAKIIIPEDKDTKPEHQIDQGIGYGEGEKPHNVIDAAATGAVDGLGLAVNIGAMLIAFIGLIALLNGIIGGIGGWFGFEDLSFQIILGYILSPLAYLMGVAWEEAFTAGSMIGQKLILNEFVAYVDFVQVKDQLSEKTQVIITFALCGFANLSSVAILLGGLGSIAPQRRAEIASIGLKAVAAGSLSNLMSAVLAGIFLSL
jgi:CNT family concentrative nucleoside transporter